MTEDFDNERADLDGKTVLYKTLEKKTVNQKDVEKYAINLDALELFSPFEKEKKLEKNNDDEIWQNLDVKLIDILNSFIATSERPVFLIRNDMLVYINKAALSFFDIDSDKDFIGSNFFNMVVKEDWLLLSENIGEMITNSKEVKIRIKNVNGKITSTSLRAIYLPESDNFSFILFGEHKQQKDKSVYGGLRDAKTGLPNFFLFEDRVNIAVKEELLKEQISEMQNIAVVALNIDNMESFKAMHIDDFIVDQIVENLSLSLPKNTTIAMGIRYSFWLMLKSKTKEDLESLITCLLRVLNKGVRDNLTDHKLNFSMGVSLFPHNYRDAKKMMEHAIKDLEKNQGNKEYKSDFTEK